MEVTYQPVLDKNEAKAVRKISRNVYKHNKFRKMMSLGDLLLYLFLVCFPYGIWQHMPVPAEMIMGIVH